MADLRLRAAGAGNDLSLGDPPAADPGNDVRLQPVREGNDLWLDTPVVAPASTANDLHLHPVRAGNDVWLATPPAAGEPVVTITLDTTAPTVTWGAQTGTTAGELLQLSYISDEPIAAAQLQLAGGRVLQLQVDPSILSVGLPFDVTDGPASVRVVDDVGNARTYPAIVVIHGTIVVVPEPTALPRAGAPPRRVDRPRSRVIRRHVALEASTTSRVRARARRHITWPASTSSASRAHRARDVAVSHSLIPRLQSRQTTRAAPTPARLELAVRRRDGPDLEDLLLLL
jgi:hypothetical protein